MSTRLGCFLAPHHPIGENPTLLLQRDLELAVHLDALGYDEFWCGEHHSTGWEIIGSPEVFLAAAADRTSRMRLGTGVVSMPYHHPFHVAERIVLLDHLSRGRMIFGSGPGALPTDAEMLGLDPMTLRDRHDEALGVAVKLLRGERVSVDSEWFRLKDGALQLLPVQEELPMAVSSSISPSGMQLAGKYGIGALSVASTSTDGLQALPLQWSFAEDAAAQYGTTVRRDDWRVLMTWHIAESRAEAKREAMDGHLRWHNEYKVDVLHRPSDSRADDAAELIEEVSALGATGIGPAVIGTPDDLLDAIRKMQELTGGFGVLLGLAHDWADREKTLKSWELVARYVAPALGRDLEPLVRSRDYVAKHQPELLKGASAATLARIKANTKAAEALKATQEGRDATAFRPGVDLTDVEPGSER